MIQLTPSYQEFLAGISSAKQSMGVDEFLDQSQKALFGLYIKMDLTDITRTGDIC